MNETFVKDPRIIDNMFLNMLVFCQVSKGAESQRNV